MKPCKIPQNETTRGSFERPHSPHPICTTPVDYFESYFDDTTVVNSLKHCFRKITLSNNLSKEKNPWITLQKPI